MEAKGTVMEVPAIRELFKERPQIKTIADLNNMFRQLAKAQAEISFKAGQEEERKKHYTIENYDRETFCYEKGKKAGIKEVAEWIEGHQLQLYIIPTVWQAKLKEWGIK